MIKITNIKVYNFENAIRGMRNPFESFDKSDSFVTPLNCYNLNCPDVYESATGFCKYCIDNNLASSSVDINNVFVIGNNDMELALKLVKAGAAHRKFLRQIFVSMDITAPLYWWKECDQYRIGVTTNSTSTMHTLHKKFLTIDDFSFDDKEDPHVLDLIEYLNTLINDYNHYKKLGYENLAQEKWRKLIQLLPSSYNQTRTWTANYEVLRNIYHQRKNHKLVEWKEFCNVLEELPYSIFVTIK